MDIASVIDQVKPLVPKAQMLTKPINSVGDYLFFSHMSFAQTVPKVHMSIYLARKELRTDLADVFEVLETLMAERSELFEIEKMRPVPMEGLFVIYQIDIAVHLYYQRGEIV